MIRGIVLGKSRTDFVEGATVEIRDLQGLVRTRTKTDSKGSFQFNVPVSPGGTAYRILVHAEGYSLSTMFTNVLLGDNPTVLIPLGFILPPVGVSGVVG